MQIYWITVRRLAKSLVEIYEQKVKTYLNKMRIAEYKGV